MKWEIRKKRGKDTYTLYTVVDGERYGYTLFYDYHIRQLKEKGVEVMWLDRWKQDTKILVDTFEGSIEEVLGYVELLKLIEE